MPTSRRLIMTTLPFLAGVLGRAWATPAAAAGAPAAPAKGAPAAGHAVAILVDSDETRVMGHAISYTMNLTRSYADSGDNVRIEIVANGSGITLLRADTSPLQEPLATLRKAIPDLVLSMCASSRQIAEQREGRSIPLVPGARLVPFGIRRVIDLQEAGWSSVHG